MHIPTFFPTQLFAYFVKKLYLCTKFRNVFVCTRFQIGLLTLIVACLSACSSPTAEEYYRRGKQFRESDQPVEAMKSFIASTRVSSREYIYKARSYSNMATMCRIAERHETAYALYEKSLEQFVLSSDTLAQAYALNNMAWEQAVLANKHSAILLIDSALSVCTNESVQIKVQESLAAACLYAAEYDSVLFYTAQVSSLYFDMLRAQAYTFLSCNDSALWYAKRVVEHTNNPRYLDDVYYILAHCDASAEVDDIRKLADERTDIQRTLERARPDWIEAMSLAEQALHPQRNLKPFICILLAIITTFVAAFVVWLWWQHNKQASSLEQQCRALRKSANIREELHWNNYPRFCAVCNERLSGIADKLDQKGLSEREIRICILVLIGFSYAEIAEILYRAESGIGKDKYLIAKHLGVSVKDLQTTLRDIANKKSYA